MHLDEQEWCALDEEEWRDERLVLGQREARGGVLLLQARSLARLHARFLVVLRREGQGGVQCTRRNRGSSCISTPPVYVREGVFVCL